MFSSDTIESATAGEAMRRREPASLAAVSRLLREHGSTRLVTVFCCVLGVCLLSPSLWSGLVADDYFHELMLRDDPGLRGLSHGALDLFRFADGRPESARALINEGVFPWWVEPK